MRIMLSVDGSGFNKCVVNAVKRLKLYSDTAILVLSEAMQPLAAEPWTPVSMELQVQMEGILRERANEIAKSVLNEVKRITDAAGCRAKAEVVGGNAKYSIVDTAKEWKPDLIIMGSHGYGFIKRSLLGSVSSYVSQHAPCSVLISRCAEVDEAKEG
jgi:nucleotide-binding universal stress UspA family protein